MIHCHLLFQLSYPRMWYRAFWGSSTCFVRQEHVNRRAARAGRDLDEPGPEAEGETGRACDRSDARMQALSRRSAKFATECPAGADRANENERRLANPAHEIARAAKLDPARRSSMWLARANIRKNFCFGAGALIACDCKRKIHQTVSANAPRTAELQKRS